MTICLVLDFGGTKHAAAVWRPGDRAWLAYRRIDSLPRATADDDLLAMKSLGREMLGGQRPAAIGVSFGGPVDFDSGTVRLSHHVTGWENQPLGASLTKTFHGPTVVDNDANAAALGEHRFGAGQGCDSLLYVTVSTGVGGGLVLQGKTWRGVDGMAGEIGHTVVDPDGPLCLCGKRGCVERLSSGPYMAQDWLAAQSDYGGSHVSATGQMVAERAAMGDPLAKKILGRGAKALGVGLGNAANLFNPQRIVLGGGVTKSGDWWWEKVRHAATETALSEITVDIVPAALGDDAPLWGAAIMAQDVLEQRATSPN